MKKTIFLSTIILLLTACQDYLETNPDSTFIAQSYYKKEKCGKI